MSDTRYERVEQAIVRLEDGTGAVGEFVSADMARQLMRELAAERRQYVQCSEALNRAMVRNTTTLPPSASEAPRWRGVMLDLIALAEVSMRQANRDGGEYLIEEELRPARELLNRTDR